MNYGMTSSGRRLPVRMARNATLEGKLAPLLAEAEKEYEETGARVRKYTSFRYSAGSWHGRERKVVAKAEYNEHGRNPRFILTTREGEPGEIYEKEFCPRWARGGLSILSSPVLRISSYKEKLCAFVVHEIFRLGNTGIKNQKTWCRNFQRRSVNEAFFNFMVFN